MPTVELKIPINPASLDFSPEGDQVLDRKARIAALILGYNSIRHFEMAAKEALIELAENKKAVKATAPTAR